MSENPTNTPEAVRQAATEAQAAEQQATEAGSTPAAEGGTEDDEGEREDSLPEWARERLSKANGEAARYRTQLREAQDQLKNAKTQEDFEAARTTFTQQIEALERDLMVERVVRKTGLPETLIDRLKGATEEELTADAQFLVNLAPAPKQEYPDAGGGLDPSSPGDGIPNDPKEVARLLKKHQGFF